jgi:hypothetical protein
MAYDAAGRQLSQTTSNLLDSAGRTLASIDAAGLVTAYQYPNELTTVDLFAVTDGREHGGDAEVAGTVGRSDRGTEAPSDGTPPEWGALRQVEEEEQEEQREVWPPLKA